MACDCIAPSARFGFENFFYIFIVGKGVCAHTKRHARIVRRFGRRFAAGLHRRLGRRRVSRCATHRRDRSARRGFRRRHRKGNVVREVLRTVVRTLQKARSRLGRAGRAAESRGVLWRRRGRRNRRDGARDKVCNKGFPHPHPVRATQPVIFSLPTSFCRFKDGKQMNKYSGERTAAAFATWVKGQVPLPPPVEATPMKEQQEEVRNVEL
jgi:hypothetical protein